jgi:type II secretion system protein D
VCVAADDGPAADASAAPAAPPKDTSGATAAPKAKSRSKTRADHRISLNFKAASWSKVLKRVARHAGLTLVMKTAPTGTFTRHDLNQYSVAEVLWILNRELEPSGFRLIQQGGFLMLLDLDGLRSGYSPAVARRQVQEQAPQPGAGVQQVGGQQAGGEPPLLESVAPETAHESAAAGHDDDENNDEIANKKIRLFYMSTPWSQVLARVAKQAGLVLVMQRCPSGTFQHPDFRKITVFEALQIINKELDDTNFRLVRQGQFLVVLYTPDLRTEYERPVVHARRRHEPRDDDSSEERPARSRTNSDVRQVVHEQEAWRAPESGVLTLDDASVSTPGPQDFRRESLARETSGPMLLTPGEPAVPPPAPVAALPKPEEFEEAPGATPQTSNFIAQHDTATAVAQRLYASLKGRTELLQAGLNGLPSFRVFDAPSEHRQPLANAGRDKRADFPTTFTVALDAEHNRLVIEATPRRLSAALRLCEQLDKQSATSGLLPLQLVSADAETCAVARNLAPQLNRLVAERGPVESLAQAVPAPPPAKEPNAPQQGTTLPPTGQQGISEIIKGLKGDVTVESVPELGILILRGGQSDVNAVMKVIREIERLSAAAVPQIELFPLKYVDSESLSKLLNDVYKALASARVEGAGAARAAIQFFPIMKPNSLLILAPPADIAGVKRLASQLDQPVTKEVEFQVFHLQHGYADQVARSVMGFYASPRALGTSVNVFADPRTNSIIVQARPRDLAEVGRLVLQLDAPTAARATIKIFHLENGDATAIQRLLETLFGTAQQPTRPGQPPQQQPGGQFGGAPGTAAQQQAPTQLRLSVDIRTNSIIALGPPDTLQAVEAVILRLDNSDVHTRQTTVVRLKNNAADNVARALTEFVQSQRQLQQIDPEAMSSVELLEREVFVVAEPVSNSLLLSATPRYYTQLKEMIDKLDAPPAQVIIQALIVEVALDNDDEFGIEMGFQSPVLFDRSNIGNLTTLQTTTTVNPTTSVAQNVLLSSTATPGFQFGDPTTWFQMTNPQSPGVVGSQELTSLGVGRTSPNLPGISGLVLSASSESVSALLRALSYKQTVHVLSRPQIRTLDNRMASIQVGQRVPVIFGATINATTGTPQPIIQYDNAGIILTVQPRITPDGMIALEAYAEKSEYNLTAGAGVTLISVPGGTSVTSPIKSITRAEASVNVASGNTVVMGGMITSSDTVTTSKVPWLGDVPIIGQAFRYDQKVTSRTELLIFLTPRVIRDDADEEMIKQVETERIHFLQDEAEAIHGPILGTRPPALQECPQEGPPVAPIIPRPGSPLSSPVLPMPSMPSPPPTIFTPQPVPSTPPGPGPAMPGPAGPGPAGPGPTTPGGSAPAPPAVGPQPPQSGLTPPAAMPPSTSRMNLTPSGLPEDSGSVRAVSN